MPGNGPKKPMAWDASMEKLCRAIEKDVLQCVPIPVACQKNGLSKNAWSEWQRRALEKPESTYSIFVGRLLTAEAKAESVLVIEIRKGVKKNTKLAMDFLKARFDGWSDKTEVKHSGRVGLEMPSLEEVQDTFIGLKPDERPEDVVGGNEGAHDEHTPPEET